MTERPRPRLVVLTELRAVDVVDVEPAVVVDDGGRLVGAISTERLLTLLDGALEAP